jgi:hypothetical protein
MRVELIYSPGCNTYKKALDVLETVIAEERLPIAIEITETSEKVTPIIRINGTELEEATHEFEGDPCFLSSSSSLVGSGAPCFEQLRVLLSQKWQELTAPAV